MTGTINFLLQLYYNRNSLLWEISISCCWCCCSRTVVLLLLLFLLLFAYNSWSTARSYCSWLRCISIFIYQKIYLYNQFLSYDFSNRFAHLGEATLSACCLFDFVTISLRSQHQQRRQRRRSSARSTHTHTHGYHYTGTHTIKSFVRSLSNTIRTQLKQLNFNFFAFI